MMHFTNVFIGVLDKISASLRKYLEYTFVEEICMQLMLAFACQNCQCYTKPIVTHGNDRGKLTYGRMLSQKTLERITTRVLPPDQSLYSDCRSTRDNRNKGQGQPGTRDRVCWH